VKLLSCAATVKVGMLKLFTFVASHDNVKKKFLLSSKFHKNKEDLMQLTLNTRKSNIGTCPHGLPLGSCPICNGMAGGGAKKGDFSAKPGEMSWNECAAIGAFLKAQKLAQQTRQQDAINYAQQLANFQKKLDKIQQNIINFNNILLTNIPKIISVPIIFATKILIQKPLNFIQNIPQVFTNITTKLADIASKITSVLGEIKTAINKKINENLSEFKKKIKSLFEIFETLNLHNEDKKIDEEKKIFELKTFIHSLKEKITKGNHKK